MAQLIGSHPNDGIRCCLACLEIAEARYNGAFITDTEDGTIVEARMYTCTRPECGSTYTTDLEPRPTLTEADLGNVTDRREWNRWRTARMAGIASVALSMPPDLGRYALLGNLLDGYDVVHCAGGV